MSTEVNGNGKAPLWFKVLDKFGVPTLLLLGLSVVGLGLVPTPLTSAIADASAIKSALQISNGESKVMKDMMQQHEVIKTTFIQEARKQTSFLYLMCTFQAKNNAQVAQCKAVYDSSSANL